MYSSNKLFAMIENKTNSILSTPIHITTQHPILPNINDKQSKKKKTGKKKISITSINTI